MQIDNDSRLIIRVARMYYLEGLTQQEIGEMLGFSRVKINRLLQRARELEIVKISIDAPDTPLLDQEDALRKKLNLRDAVVVQATEPGEQLYQALAEGTARWLTTHLQPGLRIGLGMGRTLTHLPRVFPQLNLPEVIFNEIIGGTAQTSGGLVTYNITSSMASLTGGKAEYIYAPTILSNPESTQTLLNEPSIALALDNARKCDIVIQSVGPIDDTALLYIHGYLTSDQVKELQDHGAVGDILGHYIDRDGQVVPNPVEDCIIGLTLQDLLRVPFSTVVASGMAKVPVLRAALKGHYFNVVITDSQTAAALLED